MNSISAYTHKSVEWPALYPNCQCSPRIYVWIIAYTQIPSIVSSYQHCNEQQFQTLSCALYTFFFSNKDIDLVIQALLLDYILALGKKYAYGSRSSYFYTEINIFEHF